MSAAASNLPAGADTPSAPWAAPRWHDRESWHPWYCCECDSEQPCECPTCVADPGEGWCEDCCPGPCMHVKVADAPASVSPVGDGVVGLPTHRPATSSSTINPDTCAGCKRTASELFPVQTVGLLCEPCLGKLEDAARFAS